MIEVRSFPDGVYHGEMQAQKRHGAGSFAWHDGQIYAGE